MKSVEMCDQGDSGMGIGLSLPAGSVCGTFEWAHFEHEDTAQCTSLSGFGHRYFSHNRW